MNKEIKKLQDKLNELPLIPLNKRLRNKRNKLSIKLLKLAKENFCVEEINLLGGK